MSPHHPAIALLVSSTLAVAAAAAPVTLRTGKLLDGRGGAIAAATVDGDPTKDITALKRVVFVMKGGKVLRNELSRR